MAPERASSPSLLRSHQPLPSIPPIPLIQPVPLPDLNVPANPTGNPTGNFASPSANFANPAVGAVTLAVEDLSYRYGNHTVLNDVSIDVHEGQVCGLLGPNGSGKTTLFRCCMNFLKPHNGRISMAGQDTRSLSPAKLARLVSYVPQDHRQAFPFPVQDVVRMGRTPHMGALSRLSPQDIRLADEAMERVGISHLASTPCNSLSGGQRQLVLIARAVAQGSPLMLLDEPTSALDFQNQLEVWKTLRQIAKQGVTVVVCCHDPNHILWFCDQVIIMRQGEVCADGQPGHVLEQGGLAAIYGDACAHGIVNGLPIVHPRLG